MRLIDPNRTLGGFEDQTVITKEWLNSVEQEIGGFIQSRLGKVDYSDMGQLEKAVVDVCERGVGVSSVVETGEREGNTQIESGVGEFLVVQFDLLLEWKDGEHERKALFQAIAGKPLGASGDPNLEKKLIWSWNHDGSHHMPNVFLKNGTLWVSRTPGGIKEVTVTTNHFRGLLGGA